MALGKYGVFTKNQQRKVEILIVIDLQPFLNKLCRKM
jgi:hypothetical protein